MRQKTLAGLVLLIAPALVIMVSAVFDLELQSVVLLGVAAGAAIGLVPDRTPLQRLAGVGAGVLVAWIGYVVRAAMLPDTAGGQAAAFALVLLACVLIAVAVDALPLWSLLLGVAAVAGAYEYTFAAAPTEVVSTSLTAVTSLLLTLAAGFLAASTFSTPGATAERRRAEVIHTSESDDRLDDLLEHSK